MNAYEESQYNPTVESMEFYNDNEIITNSDNCFIKNTPYILSIDKNMPDSSVLKWNVKFGGIALENRLDQIKVYFVFMLNNSVPISRTVNGLKYTYAYLNYCLCTKHGKKQSATTPTMQTEHCIL